MLHTSRSLVAVSAFLALFMVGSSSVFAASPLLRWTAAEDADGSIHHVLDVLSLKLGGIPLSSDLFILAEDRDLAFNHYKRYVQVADGVPVHGRDRKSTRLNSSH